MKIFNNYFKLCFLTAILCFSSCETIDLEQTEDPSGVSQKLLDPIYTFNYIQLKLPEFVDSANDFTQRVTRQMAMTGGNTYDNAFAPINFNNNWSIGYNILNAVKIMEPKAIKDQRFYALGASKVIRAYVLMTMVDMYGDIPLSEALQGNGNLTPKFDKSADVYKQILLDIDEAVTILNTPASVDSGIQDLYYSSKSSWVTLANTLKLKMYNNSRLAGNDIGVANIGAAITAIISGGDYIDSPAKDFAFKYGNSRFTPNTRHPLYNDQYEIGGGAYIANYMMWAMTTEKGDSTEFPNTVTQPGDPRVDFYFCKQIANPADYTEDTFTLPGRSRPVHYDDAKYYSFFDSAIKTPYVVSNWTGQNSLTSNGFWGRDHGDNSGIPPDGNLRTCAGLYPIGGAYVPVEANQKSLQNSGTDGALGAGIMPILLSSYVHFIKAEAILTLGISGDAKAELRAGISESIDKAITPINNYPIISKTDRPYTNYDEATYQPGQLVTNLPNTGDTNTTVIENYSSYGKISIKSKKLYLDFIENNFDSFSANDKLELVIKEYYIAAWGNGIEPYNSYRRTGFPSNFQPTLEFDSGAYYSTALYPGNSVNNNPNAPNNVRTRKVFWDKSNILLH